MKSFVHSLFFCKIFSSDDNHFMSCDLLHMSLGNVIREKKSEKNESKPNTKATGTTERSINRTIQMNTASYFQSKND